MSVVGITTKGNPEQQEAVRLMMDNYHPIVIITGCAGTGKNFISLAAGLQCVAVEKKYGSLKYGRNPVQMGADMGFLKGGLDDKFDPFLGPLFDNLEHISRMGKTLTDAEMKRTVEALPIAFLRGRSFEDSFIIIDEAQNLDWMSLKTIATRIGKFCKLVFTGSFNQVDDSYQKRQIQKYGKCDFQRFTEKMEELEIVAHVELKQSMRSEWCVMIDDVLSAEEKTFI